MSPDATALVLGLTMGPILIFMCAYMTLSIFTNVLEIRQFNKLNATADQWYLYAEMLLETMRQEMIHIDLAIQQHPAMQTDEVIDLQCQVKRTIEEVMPRRLRNFHEDKSVQLPPRIKRPIKHKRVTKEFVDALNLLPMRTDDLARSTTEAISQFRKLQRLCGYAPNDVVERPYPERDYTFVPSRRILQQEKSIKA